MSQPSQEKPAGNTKTAGPVYQQYCWFITLPAEETTASQLSQHLKGFCKKFTFQKERGEGGFEHWQIEVSLRHKEYFQTFKNILGFNKAHIEATQDYFAAKNYCSKKESRIEGPYNEKSVFLNTIEDLYPWQQDMTRRCLEEPDDRKIVWIYNPEGNAGKTQWAKYMAIKHNATVLNNGAFKDLAQAIPDDPKIVIFNIPRSVEEAVNYGAIECIKDGIIFSAKYESRTKIFNSPHVIILANFHPRVEEMTIDRWEIITI